MIHLENFQVANFNILKLSSLKVIPSLISFHQTLLTKSSSNPSKWHPKLDNWGYNTSTWSHSPILTDNW